jgi:hypothetical protein
MKKAERVVALDHARDVTEAARLARFPLSALMAFLEAQGLRYKTGFCLTGHKKERKGSDVYIAIELPYGTSSVQLFFDAKKRRTVV